MCTMLHRQNSNDPFIDWIATCDQKSILYSNLNDQPNGFLMTMETELSPTDYGDCLVCHHWRYPFRFRFLVCNQSINFEVYSQQLIEIYFQLSKIQSALDNRWSPILFHENARSEVARMGLHSWDARLRKVPYITHISRPLTTTFSSILTMFYAKKHSAAQKMQKLHSKTAFNNFWPTKF